MVRIIEARRVRDYVIRVRFADGVEGDVDLKDELYCEVFEPLKDVGLFKSLMVNPDWHTVSWPNGADFAPEFLYSAVEASRLTRRSSRRPKVGRA